MNRIPNLYRIFTGSEPRIMAYYQSPIDRGILGHGITLVPLDIPNNRDKFGNLYRNNIKLNDTIFRIGGLCSGFNDKSYCSLIQYDDIKSSGIHCIINANGDIVLKAETPYLYPYCLNGCIASIDRTYYNLLTGAPIVKGNTNIRSSQYLFVENAYDNDYKKGVWKIDWNTGEYEIFE
jgi:hypothetical protein